MNSYEIIYSFYRQESQLCSLLIKHSEQVKQKALSILAYAPETLKGKIDLEILGNGAMLHDIGICLCDARNIFCEGTKPYLAHGILGASMLREYGLRHHVDMEPLARICERHTGSGLTNQQIRQQNLPIPQGDYLPKSMEEKLICLADKFYSKSGDMKEKSLDNIICSMKKFGDDSVNRFIKMCIEFNVHIPEKFLV